MDDQKIEPALSEAEWKSLRHGEPPVVAFIEQDMRGRGVVLEVSGWSNEKQAHGPPIRWLIGEKTARALAALFLFGQPEGFTQEDVDKLRAMSDGTGYASIDDPAWFASLIARLAALLPVDDKSP